jgi:hypothetical protein
MNDVYFTAGNMICKVKILALSACGRSSFHFIVPNGTNRSCSRIFALQLVAKQGSEKRLQIIFFSVR